jgi:hypothetical protein
VSSATTVCSPLSEHMFYTTGMCNAAVAENPLEALICSIQGFVVGSTFELTPTELGEHLIRLRHGIDLLELGFASEAAVFAATDEYDAQGSVSPIDWIRHHCHMSRHAAARAVAAGEQVHRLPASVAALEAGDIGFAHFSLLGGTARALSATSTDDVDALEAAGARSEAAGDDPSDPAHPIAPVAPLPFDERTLLELAREHSVGRFIDDCTQARHAHDAAAVLAEAVSAAERNRCEFLPCEGGFLALRGYFDPIAAATLQTAVFPLAKPTGAGDHRPLTRRFADALVEIAMHALDLGGCPAPAGRAPTSSSPPRWRR